MSAVMGKVDIKLTRAQLKALKPLFTLVRTSEGRPAVLAQPYEETDENWFKANRAEAGHMRVAVLDEKCAKAVNAVILREKKKRPAKVGR